jgi:hypothetical protein
MTVFRKSLHRLATAGQALHTTAIAEQAVPAVAPVTKSKGLFASIFGSTSRIDIPLTDPLPDVVHPEHVEPPKVAPKTQLTALSNGLKIASENTPVSK